MLTKRDGSARGLEATPPFQGERLRVITSQGVDVRLYSQSASKTTDNHT